MAQSESNRVGFTQEELDEKKRVIAIKQANGEELTYGEKNIVAYGNGFRCHACVPEVASSIPPHSYNDPGFSQN